MWVVRYVGFVERYRHHHHHHKAEVEEEVPTFNMRSREGRNAANRYRLKKQYADFYHEKAYARPETERERCALQVNLVVDSAGGALDAYGARRLDPDAGDGGEDIVFKDPGQSGGGVLGELEPAFLRLLDQVRDIPGTPPPLCMTGLH